MSLTSLLKKRDIKEKFSQGFPKPRFSLKKEILAPPITKNYGIVGTAFDYLVRFYIERFNTGVISNHWVAESAVEIMREYGIAIFRGSRVKIPKDLIQKATEIISEAKVAYSGYIESGEITYELVKYAILLAQLDTYYRRGIIDEKFGTVEEGDVTDLTKLISIVNPDNFKAKEICILNPKFGKASILVGGADADLIIDNRLIDIKTTKNLELRRRDFNQLVGYYILSKIDGIDSTPSDFEIEKLEIYYSRYGEPYPISVKDIIDEAKLSSFMKWFEKRAAEERSI